MNNVYDEENDHDDDDDDDDDDQLILFVTTDRRQAMNRKERSREEYAEKGTRRIFNLIFVQIYSEVSIDLSINEVQAIILVLVNLVQLNCIPCLI